MARPPLSDTLRRVFVPSLNVSVPVGVPAPGATAATVAVNVTDCPRFEGLRDEVTVVVVPSLFTVWVRVLLVLNRMPNRSKMTEQLVGQIRGLLTPPAVDLAETRVGNRIAYAGALLSGRAVTETDRTSKAADEMHALAAEILRRA